MVHLSAETKQAIILKAVNRGKTSLAEVAKTNNVGLSTLQRWLNAYKTGRVPGTANHKHSQHLTPIEKQHHSAMIEGLDCVAKSAYCRQHGLYRYEVDQWKEELMKQSDSDAKIHHYKSEITELKNKCRALEKELNRKDKALSDASTLLILKKKAELIWGETEDD